MLASMIHSASTRERQSQLGANGESLLDARRKGEGRTGGVDTEYLSIDEKKSSLCENEGGGDPSLRSDGRVSACSSIGPVSCLLH